MDVEHIPVVFTGHIDHGKSTLIGRLLYDTNSLPEEKMREIRIVCEELRKEVEFAYVMDSLREEREQQRTIGTALIQFRSGKRIYNVIDIPGHKEFIRDAVTGMHDARMAVLLVDATDGFLEQTLRHLFLLYFLGLTEIVVAVNKMDKVGYRESHFFGVKQEATSALRKYSISPLAVIPISALYGENVVKRSENMKWYTEETLLEIFNSVKEESAVSSDDFLFPVQDVYKMEGVEVAAGRVESGSVTRGEGIIVHPAMTRSGIRSIWKSGRKNLRSASSGENIGLVLTKCRAKRGDILTKPYFPLKPVNEFSAGIYALAGLNLSHRQKYLLRISTQEVMCRIAAVKNVIDPVTLETSDPVEGIPENHAAEILIKSARPVLVAPFSKSRILGRIILEEKGQITLFGITQGIIA